jgi:hypothetical protein
VGRVRECAGKPSAERTAHCHGVGDLATSAHTHAGQGEKGRGKREKGKGKRGKGKGERGKRKEKKGTDESLGDPRGRESRRGERTQPVACRPIQNRGWPCGVLDISSSIPPSVTHGMRFCSRCGSSPSHAGFCAVPSKMDEVLKGSNSPRAAAAAVFDSNAVNSVWLKGRNVRAASHA